MPLAGRLGRLGVDVFGWLAEDLGEALLPVLDINVVNAAGTSCLGRLGWGGSVGSDGCHCVRFG